MYLNGFENYAVQVLITRNNESVELELKKTGENFQDKDELVLNNYIRNEI